MNLLQTMKAFEENNPDWYEVIDKLVINVGVADGLMCQEDYKEWREGIQEHLDELDKMAKGLPVLGDEETEYA